LSEPANDDDDDDFLPADEGREMWLKTLSQSYSTYRNGVKNNKQNE
jgi:hypothetical protein